MPQELCHTLLIIVESRLINFPPPATKTRILCQKNSLTKQGKILIIGA